MVTNPPKLVFAADAADKPAELLKFCEELMRHFPDVWIKFGLGWAMTHGLPVLAEKRWLNPRRLFLDMKILDIDATMIAALNGALGLFKHKAPVGMINIHAAKGMQHLAAIAKGVGEANPHTKLIGVTVLTDMDSDDLHNDLAVTNNVVGEVTPANLALRRAHNAALAGLAGVVCSPQEVATIKQACGPAFLKVVPGIRPAGSTTHDQKRIGTPAQAVVDGADFAVIGRPIWEAPDRLMAVAAILDEMAAARG